MASLKNHENAIFKLFNYEKLSKQFETEPKKGLKTYPIVIEGKSLIENLSAEVTTNGISAHSWENGATTFSLGIRLNDEENYEYIDHLVQKLAEKLPEDFETTTPVKGESIYLKLKLKADKKTFTTKTNIKINVSKYQEADITRTQDLTAKLEFFAYVDMTNKRAGIAVTPIELTFQE